MDYQTYAYLQLAQDRAARRMVDALPEIQARFDPSRVGSAAPGSAGVFALAAIPARYALERQAWGEAAALELRPSRFPQADAMTWFARGLGAAHTGDLPAARAASDALQQLEAQLAKAGETYWAEQVAIQRLGVSAWTAFKDGRTEEALTTMRSAADREDRTEKNAVTPGPIAPARELLGYMLIAAKRPADALAAFDITLTKEPNRYRALAGAVEAARADWRRETAVEEVSQADVRADREGRRSRPSRDRGVEEGCEPIMSRSIASSRVPALCCAAVSSRGGCASRAGAGPASSGSARVRSSRRRARSSRPTTTGSSRS